MRDFIKSLQRPGNETLIEAILEGYNAIFENNEVAYLVAQARKFKTVDEFIRYQGEPFYHGARGDWTGDFKVETKSKNDYGIFGEMETERHGAFFTDSKNYAIEHVGKGGRIIEVRLDVDKTLVIDKFYEFENVKNAFKNQYDAHTQSDLWDDIQWGIKEVWELFEGDRGRRFVEFIKKQGYDSVKFSEGLVDKNKDAVDGMTTVVFDPSKIKTISQLTDIWNKAHSSQSKDGLDHFARGVNKSAYKLYASGMCDVFALALNKLYGYEPYVVRGYYKDGDEYAYENSHAVVKSSKGFLDYKGLISEQELKKAAHFTNNVEFVKIEPVSVEELKECFTSEPIPEIEIEKAVDYIKNNNSLFEATGKSELQKLKDNKVPLTDEERKEVFKKDAVWHSGSSIDPNTGEKVQKVSAVWKSKHPKTGDITYISNTHRAYNTAKSLDAIINKYHNFIKDTA